MNPPAKIFLKSCPLRRGPKAYANSIPTTQWPSSRTCRRTSRPRFSSSSRHPSGSRWRAACSIRKTPPAGAARIILREILVGLVNGLAFAVITGVAAAGGVKVLDLGLVIGLAMICNLLAGALGGILVPLVLHRFHADPAISSGVFVTTVTDVVGFFSFLGIATLWFGLK